MEEDNININFKEAMYENGRFLLSALSSLAW